jgi:DNA-binding CsgD family transcriptional regulator
VHLAEGVGNLRRSVAGDQIASVVRGRRGTAYPPDAVDAFLPQAEAVLGSVAQAGSVWVEVMAAEPGPTELLSEERLDRTFRALADFADLKSRYLVGHSSGVAVLARAAAQKAGLPAAARIVAAADAFHAMTEPRPHRPAMSADQAAAELRGEVRAGRIEADAAEVVLQAAGQPARRRRDQVAGLTAREVEVLRLLARGASTREIASALVISPKTADAHVQHIYTKAGVSTRAAATLFAMQHDLLGPTAG